MGKYKKMTTEDRKSQRQNWSNTAVSYSTIGFLKSSGYAHTRPSLPLNTTQGVWCIHRWIHRDVAKTVLGPEGPTGPARSLRSVGPVRSGPGPVPVPMTNQWYHYLVNYSVAVSIF